MKGGEMTTATTHPATTITLPSDQEIRITRTFAAPRRLVFEACTKPEHLRRWWGPRNTTLTQLEMDFRVGGRWRFVLQGPDGSEHPFCGEYREIAPPDRFVQTFVYDVPVIRDHPAVETATFEEQDGKTTLTVTILHGSKVARDGHLQSGMEGGLNESHERLEELLATIVTCTDAVTEAVEK
jgi:uncharacterized protein YndB with AHSA1/START domain